MVRVAINGLGRIGRAALNNILETPELKLTAVNDLIPPENLAYLLRYDTVYGRSTHRIEAGQSSLVIDGNDYPVLGIKDPAQLPWGDLVKVMAWYDNEWGYSVQMIREDRRIAERLSGKGG